MNLKETIYKRQSIRKYEDIPLDDDSINDLKEFIDNCKVLNSEIEWSYEIVGRDNIKSRMNWKAPYYLLLYSEELDNYYENIGFIFQQVDLYLQSKGIGSCWLGAGSPKNMENKHKNQKFIIALAFGKSSDNIYREKEKFKRNCLDNISDKMDDKLIPAQLAPSAINSQPWYFTHDHDNTYNIYRVKQNFIKRRLLNNWNQVDIGIALAHMYVSNRDTFNYFIKENPKKIDNYYYEGSFKI